MDIVIDSVSVNHLTKGRADGHSDDLTALVEGRLVRVVLDRLRSIEDEWKKTAGEEPVRELATRWSELGGLVVLRRDGRLDRELTKLLDKLAFTDTCDRLIVKTATVTTDRQIVSEDSDFWDPLDKNKKGEPQAPVAALLREQHSIEVETLGAFLGKRRAKVLPQKKRR